MTWAWEKKNLSPQQELNQWPPECPSCVQEVVWFLMETLISCSMLVSCWSIHLSLDRILYIDYYMLRAWYCFYSQDFIPYRKWASLRASERAIIKKEWIKMIRLLTCNNLFITCTCYMHATSWEVFLAVFLFSFSSRNWEISSLETFTNLDKTAKQFFPPNLMGTQIFSLFHTCVLLISSLFIFHYRD